MKRIHIWLLASLLAILCGLYLRAALPFDKVFTVDGVNFQESDAWYHARMIEAFSHGLPSSTSIDPYASFPDVQRVDVGPVLDTLAVIAVKLTGIDPFVVAAWFPILLWLLLVAMAGLLARQLFNEETACIAIILAATLPGTYMRVTSLGFHDHHVLESLLFLSVLYCISRQWLIAAGAALGLYLMTFLGGAILVVFLTIWRLLSPTAPTMWRTYSLALLMLLPFRHTLWTEYSIASLAGALLLELLYLYVPKPLYRWSAIGLAAAISIWAADHFGVFHLARHFTTSQGASTVSEMKWMTPQLAWINYGPVAAFALSGIWQLARSAQPYQRMLVITALGFSLLGVFQLRLSYYVAVAIATLAAAALGQFFDSLTAPISRRFAPPVLLLLLLLPNLWSGYKMQSLDYGLSPSWREAMHWLRWNTPEPMNQPDDYNHFLPHGTAFAYPPQAYGVFAWWDYGYAITTLGHRIPFTNPTQTHATEAARIMLSPTEAEFRNALRTNRLRYAVLSDDLPMTPLLNTAIGKIPSLAKWAGIPISRYYEVFNYTHTDGKTRPLVLYYPAYYQTPLVRLSVYGNNEYIPSSDICVATIEGKNVKHYECFDNEAKAQAALAAPGTVLAGIKPLESCIRLDKWAGIESVYQSPDKRARIGDRWMYSLRIFQIQN